MDMAGNVWEWCSNWYDEDKKTCSLRGGSWKNAEDALRCSYRFSGDRNGSYDDVGFRVVCEP